MAITINQQPTAQNYSYNELVFVLFSDSVTANNRNAIEFSFVIDITVDGNTFRYRKQPNPTLRGIIDIGKIVNDNLEWEVKALGITSSADAEYQIKTFSVVFSEERLVNGTLVISNPTTAVSLSVIKGVREYNTGNTTGSFTIGPVLSEQPDTIRVHRDDSLLITNFTTIGATLTNTVVPIPATGDTSTTTVGGKEFTLDIYDDKSDLGEVRFWWFNRKGGIDCFTADQEATQSTGVTKRTADSSVITHGFTTSTNRNPRNASVFKAGTVNYGVDFDTTNTKNTRWLNQQEADLVAGLFESPEVYIQVGTEFIPTTILNNGYDALLTLREKDLFQYNIMYRYTNDKRNL